MVNNLEQILGLLQFASDDEFYHVQIIKRRKEHPEMGSTSMIIKTYYVQSGAYLQERFDEMVALAQFHNARVCINLNRRSFEKVGFETLKQVTDNIMNKDFKAIRKAYESACGSHASEREKKWIVDIDKGDDEFAYGRQLAEQLKAITPNVGEEKLYAFVPTKNGYHMITKPFNLQEARAFLADDVHKDNPTLLYMP